MTVEAGTLVLDPPDRGRNDHRFPKPLPGRGPRGERPPFTIGALSPLSEPLAVGDLRGTGTGWQVTAQATQFRGYDHFHLGPRGGFLDYGSLPLPRVDIIPAQHPRSLSAVPVAALHRPLADEVNGAVRVATAYPGQGLGWYQIGFTSPMTVLIPPNPLSAWYRSHLTYTLTEGPGRRPPAVLLSQ